MVYIVFDSSISIDTIALLYVGLLIKVCYPKRSSSPYSNVLPDLINGSLLIRKSVLIICSHLEYTCHFCGLFNIISLGVLANRNLDLVRYLIKTDI